MYESRVGVCGKNFHDLTFGLKTNATTSVQFNHDHAFVRFFYVVGTHVCEVFVPEYTHSILR